MTIYDIELDIHAANGVEVIDRYMYDSDRHLILFDVPERNEEGYVIDLTDYVSQMENAPIESRSRIHRVIEDPTDPQKHPSGFYIKEARVKETPLNKSHFDEIIRQMSRY